MVLQLRDWAPDTCSCRPFLQCLEDDDRCGMACCALFKPEASALFSFKLRTSIQFECLPVQDGCL